MDRQTGRWTEGWKEVRMDEGEERWMRRFEEGQGCGTNRWNKGWKVERERKLELGNREGP